MCVSTGNGDDGFGHRLSKVGLSVGFQFLKDHRRQFFGREVLVDCGQVDRSIALLVLDDIVRNAARFIGYF
jgi:hypothetical protein